MDITESNNPEAGTSSLSANTQPASSTSDPKPLRSSARVKAAKQNKDKGKATERDPTSPNLSSASTAEVTDARNPRTTATRSKRTRDTSKGKAKESSSDARPSKRPRRTAASTSALTINEPVQDPKGKKRAVAESPSDEEDLETSPPKRAKTSNYSLRSQTTSSKPSEMPKKARTSTKGKAAMKSKAAAMASSSHLSDDEDIGVYNAAMKHHESDDDAIGTSNEPPVEEPAPLEKDSGDRMDSDHDEEKDTNDMDEDDEDGDEDGGIPPIPGGLDDAAAAMAIFGGDFRQFGSYMLSLTSRLRGMLNNIKSTADPTTRLLTLQELSELLSISTEDTLAGFQVEDFVRELVRILGGRGVPEDEDDDAGDDEEPDEDAALAAALAMSTGNSFVGDDNLEAQVLACRCLANLMEALPGVAHTVVYHGAIPVLCSKLIEISYIDLAEQTLSTLEKISEEFPSSIVRDGGLGALLNYLDFFSIAVQRTALQAASNCCRSISPDHFPMVLSVWPIIRNCLTYSDQRLVEFASLCVIRVIDSYHRSSINKLEELIDVPLIQAVNQLLMPAGGSPLIAQNTYTLLLRALATCARGSSNITLALLEADFVATLYQILTGVLPSTGSGSSEQGEASGGQGLGGGVADMTVMDNLAHRPKEQIEEALSLISELMPPLPRDGVFDHKSYTEKALARLIKAKAKADRATAKQAAMTLLSDALLAAPTPAESPAEELAPPDVTMADPLPASTSTATTSATASSLRADRTELLRGKPMVVGRFMQLIVPILVDVYAATVATPIRLKTLTGLLKATSFLDADGISEVLKFVPIASFASSILSSNDHPTLVIEALQLVDLLLTKSPSVYKAAFRREGVFHEIETLATRPTTAAKKAEKDDSEVAPAPDAAPVHIPGLRKLSSLAIEPSDAITLRARVMKFRFMTGDEAEEGGDDFESLRGLVVRLADKEATELELSDALWELGTLFSSPHTSVSSFELIQSGLVDEFLQLATEHERAVPLERRKELIADAMVARKLKNLTSAQTPFSTFVKKLQESLTRLESFDVATVSQGSDDGKRSSPSLLARQLRLRLEANDESGIPKNLHNIVVSIHAIATFQALHDYLRPRVAGLLGGSSASRLSSMAAGMSGMLAALSNSALAAGAGTSAGGSASTPPIPFHRAPSPPPAEASTSSASAPIARRRSQRLSARRNSTSNDTETPSTTAPAEAATGGSASDGEEGGHEGAAEGGHSDTAVESELHAEDFSDDEIDAEVFDEEEVDPDASISDKTVSLAVADDGSKIEAQTPDGTRVATPTPPVSGAASKPAPPATRASYAAALKAKPTDWHVEFSMDDHPLPLDLTIYGAIHQHERRKPAPAPANMLWQGVYTVKFKKVAGPQPSTEGSDAGDRSPKRSGAGVPLSSLPEDAPHARILRLLRVLHQINAAEAEKATFAGDARNLAESAFVNNKLTAKLTRQLEEPMIVASSCLPDWALDLPLHFPFLFPFATRYNFLQSTSFGYARLILKWQSQQARGQESSRRDDGIGFLGRLQRQKVRISRNHILESAIKVFELYGSSSSVLEVEYFEEVGTGLGPTLEFYSLVSKEFARKDLKLWRDSHFTESGAYVDHPNGLFPSPISPQDIAKDGGEKRTHVLKIIGQFVAKAMLDSRIIDLHFNKIFIKHVLNEEVPLTIESLQLVDKDLAASLTKLQGIVAAKAAVGTDKLSQKVALIENVNIEDLALDFTIPGSDIELKPGGSDIAVTDNNVDEYIHDVLDAIVGKGVALQAKAFRDGFSKVFPISDLQAFSADELVMLFGNGDEDWSVETLTESVKADHGFNVESRAIRDLIDILAEYDPQTRRSCLQFVTGSPKLPIGGFRGLNPPLTVVRKPHEAPLSADDYLPSVMTCVNYLKLPEYSSKAVMKERLRVAMHEGVGSFHLS